MTIKNNRYAWINGHWGVSNELSIEIDDRGLNFADGIFETILILNGKPQLIVNHLYRWEQSALQLGMKPPPNKEWIISLIDNGIKFSNLTNKNGSLRLNWTRGSSITRGIDIQNSNLNHRFWLEFNHGEPSFNTISATISKNEKRNPHSKLSQNKTFSYGQQIQAKREAKLSGYDDALVLNIYNEMCCGTTSNLLVKRNNQFLTPTLKSGCLPGIMRGQGIKKGLFKEAKINPIPIKGDQWLLINSLSCHAIENIGGIKLEIFKNPKSLWTSLLSK